MHGGGFDVATLDGLETARTLTRRYDGSPCHDRGPDIVAFAHQQGGSIDMHTSNDCGPTLQKIQTQAVQIKSAVRRLTPVECERLQGFPDNYTLIPYRNKPADLCPDGPRYKALGNSMAVPVMRWIGERINLVHNLTERKAA